MDVNDSNEANVVAYLSATHFVIQKYPHCKQEIKDLWHI